jgi:hypothetical protein
MGDGKQNGGGDFLEMVCSLKMGFLAHQFGGHKEAKDDQAVKDSFPLPGHGHPQT